MANRFFLILIFFGIIPHSWGQDSLSLSQRIGAFRNIEKTFSQDLELNPAVKGFFYSTNWSEIGMKYQIEDKPNQLMQLGTGVDQFGVSALSFYTIDPKSAVWGSADYRNGSRKKVRWNESSDYNKVAPYIIADSVGGDLNFEKYVFSGGYAFEKASYQLGVFARYSALLEYRAIDPRPKNTTSDLEVGFGISRVLWKDYRVGLDLQLAKYTQTNAVSFYSETGNAALYHFVGLGNDNKLLYGNKKKALYEGSGYGLGFQVFNIRKPEWFFQMRYHNSDIRKAISVIQTLDVAKRSDVKTDFVIGRIFKGDHRNWGIQVEYKQDSRKGIEDRLSFAETGNLISVGKVNSYQYLEQQQKIASFYSWNTATWDYGFNSFVSRLQIEEKYKVTAAQSRITFWNIGLEANISKSVTPQEIWCFKPKISYHYAADLLNKLRDIPAQEGINQMLSDNFKIAAAQFLQTQLVVRYDVVVPKIGPVFWEGAACVQHYSKSNNVHVQTTIGITF